MNLSISEQITYTTIRIECELKTGGFGTGTGFFYNINHQGKMLPVLVTNKHVIKNASKGLLHFNLSDEADLPLNGKYHTVVYDNFESDWILHPESEIDLCILLIAPVFHKLLEIGKRVFYIGLENSFIPREEQLSELTAIEDIIMIGYPNGIWDSVNNMPIIRKGITATHPRLDYNGKKEFIIDAACFPGSSGSPVLLFNDGNFATRNSALAIGTRVMLLGILYAGPQHTAEGEIKIIDVPTQQRPVAFSRIPNNLGIVIKAEKLFDFEALLEAKLK
ncbi:MAG TPA: serine protease [Pyrinomonadaceae bacterium]|jgi:hypothetical protein